MKADVVVGVQLGGRFFHFNNKMTDLWFNQHYEIWEGYRAFWFCCANAGSIAEDL